MYFEPVTHSQQALGALSRRALDAYVRDGEHRRSGGAARRLRAPKPLYSTIYSVKYCL